MKDLKNDIIPIKIAYAEDHDLIREAIITNLEKDGRIKVIVEAGNGADLIKKMEECPEEPNVCLLDISMPKMDGFETITALKHKWPEIKILVISAYESEGYRVRMVLCGADGYLTKRAKASEMRRAIEEIYDVGLYNTELFSKEFVQSVKRKKFVLPELTALDMQLLRYSIADKTFDEISGLLGYSAKSIEAHRLRLYNKIGVKTRAGLAFFAIKFGYVGIESQETPL
ncbi:hypothetical protein DBR32_15440 [Taibaiella sp. KBW10]|uniref:response regulator transcription factor n=1 Tax=Taibaiella sp. KBW10 TaxID=2153357 RepID=UPI000F593BC6|nr:response regulator transcription factor [Taibaiella sp. KBW10]RQO29650.1 hypothetical protein DBR32_15440 [Taibaiella sp. KBW10]